MRGASWMVMMVATAVTAGSAAAQQSDDDWLANCRDRHWNGDGRAVHCEVRSVRLTRPAAGTPLTIDAGRNGGATVHGTDGDSLVARARIQANGRSQVDADAVARDVIIHTDGNRLWATGPSTGDDVSWAVMYQVVAPRRLDLDVQSHNGPVQVDGVRGTMRLTADNGPVSIDDVSGDVRLRATNGPLTIRLAGTRWDGAGLDAETRNGPATLTVPDGYSARLTTGTRNGPMRVDIPMTVQGRITREIETTLGEGGAPLRAVTVNGPVTIRRAAR